MNELLSEFKYVIISSLSQLFIVFTDSSAYMQWIWPSMERETEIEKEERKREKKGR